jgi:hypothetical protein
MALNPSQAFHIMLRLLYPSINQWPFVLYFACPPLIQVVPLNCIHDGKCVEKMSLWMIFFGSIGSTFREIETNFVI